MRDRFGRLPVVGQRKGPVIAGMGDRLHERALVGVRFDRDRALTAQDLQFRAVSRQQFHRLGGILERYFPPPGISVRTIHHIDGCDVGQIPQHGLDIRGIFVVIDVPGCLPVIGQREAPLHPIVRDLLDTEMFHGIFDRHAGGSTDLCQLGAVGLQ